MPGVGSIHPARVVDLGSKHPRVIPPEGPTTLLHHYAFILIELANCRLLSYSNR